MEGAGARIERHRGHGRRAALLPALAGGCGVGRCRDGWTASIAGCCVWPAASRRTLMGGDLARAGKLMCDIVVCGAVPRGRALRRDGARAGNAIYVSGRLGGSAAGTGGGRRSGAEAPSASRAAPGARPVSPLAICGATAAMDLSDGLSLDLRRLCLASGLSAQIAAPPRFPGATLEQSLHGGEDYELLFTVPARTRVPAEFEGLPLTRIGTMRKGPAGPGGVERRSAGAAGLTTISATHEPSRSRSRSRPDRGIPPVEDHVHGRLDGDLRSPARRSRARLRSRRRARRQPGRAGTAARRLRRARPAAQAGWGLYANDPVAEAYLVTSSPDSLHGYIRYSDEALYPMWRHLEDAVKEGTHRWKQTFGLDGPIFEPSSEPKRRCAISCAACTATAC